ncbi:type I restriction endonuclease subunit R [Sulfurovum riftiae]|uniref:Type I restriction enzyme endonuclease subunit n=1 Tax=Sulfurovum riftiae TaxID=1630136 RepID=A0A151CJH3_9BACT|nr:type I restriction endonuclease subunit R [Sulfurovum riftiae]KYJ87675.1 DEAD/DEAH box helicase [Sulfurovum riftiae]
MSYDEDTLVEQPAIHLFESMGWQSCNCYDEVLGIENGTTGREERSDVVLVRRLHDAVEKLNPGLDELLIADVVGELIRDRSLMSDIAANEEIYGYLKEGVKVESVDDDGNSETVTVKIIDWETPENNDFFLASQLWITGEVETRRTDLVGFVNGLPLVFIELKTSHRKLINAYRDNLKDYRSTIPQLFWYNQLIILSNGIQSRVGTVSSGWEHFSEWKKVQSESEPKRVSLEVMLRGTCEKNRLLDIVENFTLFIKKKETVKIVAKYHQYLGVNEALEGVQHIKELQGKLGVYWHTQGSGKSFSMIFFSQKIFRKIPGNWTFVIVTDRRDLDDQIYKGFNAAGVLTQECQADSGEELKQLLREDHRFVFTLIQKFGTQGEVEYPVLSERDDIIVITDEAHRSQYDTLAMNMRKALPNAAFIAFTGTPLLVGEEKTKEVFGDYVSVYNFSDAIEDNSTLPLYYENRVPEVNLNRDDLGDEIVNILDEADLSDEQEAKLEREFANAYHIITREERLETIAHDIVEHFMGREFMGKAMVVSIDKATAIRMYDKVQKQWKMKLDRLKMKRKVSFGSQLRKLEADIAYMEQTDMAVVVSGGQNEYERLEAKGLDLKVHRERMKREKLDEKFKDPDDPLRIVFVCAMWLTGFDAPFTSTLYLDKPLKNHTLMQAIARANRVYPGKPNGQIVDYVNIFGALQEALGHYGSVKEESEGYGTDDMPAKDKTVLFQALEDAFVDLNRFLEKVHIDLSEIVYAGTDDFEKLALLDKASEILLEPGNEEEFISYVRQINRIFKGLLPDTRADVYMSKRVAINVIYRQMKIKSGEDVDDEDVLQVIRNRVNLLLDDAIETVAIESHLPEPVDISHIDFEALAKMLERIEHPKVSDAQRLKNMIARKLPSMVKRNKMRQELQEKFQELVEQYNLGAYTAEAFFEKLKEFIQNDLEPEEKRSAREGLSEEELAIFDLLASEVELSDKERKEVKRIAKALLEKLDKALVIDWRKKQRAKAQVKRVIENVLDALPQSYDDDIWPHSVEKVYQHVFDAYMGQGLSVYAA